MESYRAGRLAAVAFHRRVFGSSHPLRQSTTPPPRVEESAQCPGIFLAHGGTPCLLDSATVGPHLRLTVDACPNKRSGVPPIFPLPEDNIHIVSDLLVSESRPTSFSCWQPGPESKQWPGLWRGHSETRLSKSTKNHARRRSKLAWRTVLVACFHTSPMEDSANRSICDGFTTVRPERNLLSSLSDLEPALVLCMQASLVVRCISPQRPHRTPANCD